MSDNGGRWFEQTPKPPQTRAPSRAPADKDLWVRCPGCSEILYRPVLAEQLQVCLRCNHHFPIGAADRIAMLADPGSFERHDANLYPGDPLRFTDSKAYADRLRRTQKALGEPDAMLAGSCTVGGFPVEIGVFEFRFLGGSMGSVVGELITRVYERALARRAAAIVVSSSGGARMQEGILSLMQMAKTCAALARLRDERLPYLSILTHPTTGGVAASFAMLGDLNIAEPKALIGFAGPRVVEQTIGQALPEGFQTSEYLLEHGLVDRIVHRSELREAVIGALGWMMAPNP